MTINMKRKISRLSHEYYKARGVGLLFEVFVKHPEATQVDNDTFRVFGKLERIGFDNPRRHLEKDKDYQRRLRKIFSKHEGTISSGIEKLNNIVDDVVSARRNKEVEN